MKCIAFYFVELGHDSDFHQRNGLDKAISPTKMK